MSASQYGQALLIGAFDDQPARALERVQFSKDSDHSFNEAWLQKLISRYPSLLPIDQIEPALREPVSICIELPLPSGNFVDNLYSTASGDLILGETKLFRNPEARREVIGQILDYAKDLSRMSYEQLEAAIRKAQAPDGTGSHPKAGLFEAVCSARTDDVLPEADFIDAVTRNLRRGRFLLLVIGDGIRSGTETLAAFLQEHAGIHFTLGLVELAVFKLPIESGGYLVQPRVLARTDNIVRGIVNIVDGAISVVPPPDRNPTSSPIAVVKTSLTAELFYEKLAQSFPNIGASLKSFMTRLESVRVTADFGKDSLILRGRTGEDRTWNLGTITTTGRIWTDFLNMQASSVNLIELSHAYIYRLAELVPGASVKATPGKPTSRYVVKNGSAITIDELLAHEDGWIKAISEFLDDMAKALAEAS